MGAILALLSAVFSSSKDVISKYLAGKVTSQASTLGSFLFALPFYLVALICAWLMGFETITLSSSFWIYVLLRSFTDAFAESCKMKALALGDLSLVANFFALYPIFLLVTSPLITGDLLTVGALVGILSAVAGALLVIPRGENAQKGSNDFKAIFFALGASLFFSLNTAFDRVAVQHGTPLFSGFAMTLVAGFMLLPGALRSRGVMRELILEPRAFLGRGLLELLFMVSKLCALQYLAAPQVVAVQRISLLLSIAGGGIILKEKDLYKRATAGALVIVGVLAAMFL